MIYVILYCNFILLNANKIQYIKNVICVQLQKNNFNCLLINYYYCLLLIFDFQTYVVFISLFQGRSVFLRNTSHDAPLDGVWSLRKESYDNLSIKKILRISYENCILCHWKLRTVTSELFIMTPYLSLCGISI